MNVQCASCGTVYRVDPAKLSEAGVRARCTVCSNVIAITATGDRQPAAATVIAAASDRRSQEQIATHGLGDAFIPVPQDAGWSLPVTPAPAAPPPPPVVAPAPSAPVVPVPVPLAAPAPEPIPAVALAPAPPVAAPVAAVVPPAAPVAPPTSGLRIAPPSAEPTAPAQLAAAPPIAPAWPSAPVFRPTPGQPVQAAPMIEPRATVPSIAAPAAAARPPAVAPVVAGPSATAPPPVSQQAPAATAPPIVKPPAPPAAPPRPAAPFVPFSAPPPGPPAAEIATKPVGFPAASTPTPIPTPARRPVNPFLSRDPHQKARRLARALISDMIVYQPDKRKKALEEGNLKQVFDAEIKKSWEQFVGDVGEELANSTSFFKEALNEILAGGQSVF